jgi:hypothetical protein|tara:strand:+ start:118 stop:303 length:186 start_codon:yes stop_codon:yes gene_type:complete
MISKGGNNMSLYSRFCAWLSGWPESNEYVRNNHEQDYLFAEEEKKIRENNNKNFRGGKPPK